MPSTAVEPNQGRLGRAFFALPFLGLAALMLRVLAMGQPIGPVNEAILVNSRFALGGVDVPIIKEFYGIPILDTIFAHITVAFAHLQFFTDQRAYWQALVFLTDFAGMYAVILIEAYRPANRCFLLRFPFIITFLAQLLPIGFFGPLYFYVFYIVTPSQKLTSPSLHSLSTATCLALLPALAVSFYLSHFLSFFHPSLEARHWWNWIWQLYGIWGSIVMFALFKVVAIARGTEAPRVGSRNSLYILRVVVGFIVLANTATYWYTLSTMEYSIPEVFVPQYLVKSPTEPDAALRVILQYDYVCSFSAGFLWLAYHFNDLEKAGACNVPWIRALVGAAIVGIIFGPGTLFLLIWLLREELLVSFSFKKKA
ncbi:hypothetical protein ACJZ2D_015299 [Fusarium nematophilum]